MNQSIVDLKNALDAALAGVQEVSQLEALKVEYLGKKGSVTALMKNMGSLSPEEKKSFGKEVNELKDYATAAISHLPHIIASSLVNLVKESDSDDGLMSLSCLQHPVCLLQEDVFQGFFPYPICHRVRAFHNHKCGNPHKCS